MNLKPLKNINTLNLQKLKNKKSDIKGQTFVAIRF